MRNLLLAEIAVGCKTGAKAEELLRCYLETGPAMIDSPNLAAQQPKAPGSLNQIS